VRGSDDSPRKTSLVDARIDAANPGYCLSVSLPLVDVRGGMRPRLARRDANLLKLLFDDRGPLQPFGSRIHLGYALGIYGGGVYADLKTIKDIRNAFAHAAEDIDFATVAGLPLFRDLFVVTGYAARSRFTISRIVFLLNPSR
jgi:hypothetical protein